MGKQQEAPLQSRNNLPLLSLGAASLCSSSGGALVPLGVQSRKGAPPGPQQQQHTLVLLPACDAGGRSAVLQLMEKNVYTKCVYILPPLLACRRRAYGDRLSSYCCCQWWCQRMLTCLLLDQCRTGVRSTPNAWRLVRTTPTTAAAMNYVPRG